MEASSNCLRLIKDSEGFRSAPYRCPAGIPTIGYGSTKYPDGRPVAMTDRPITPIQAEAILRETLKKYETDVQRFVQVPLNQNQFDALVDFSYNAGSENLRTSTLLRYLNQKLYAQAANEFDKWVMGGGQRLPGLVKRRALEKQLFLAPVAA